MEDLTKLLGDLLNSPENMKKVQDAMAALGIGDNGAEPSLPPPAPAAPLATVSDETLPDLSKLLSLAPLLADFSKDDQNTLLLKALRPYLHGDREKRLDEAIKILHFVKLMPLLRESGLLSSLF